MKKLYEQLVAASEDKNQFENLIKDMDDNDLIDALSKLNKEFPDNVLIGYHYNRLKYDEKFTTSKNNELNEQTKKRNFFSVFNQSNKFYLGILFFFILFWTLLENLNLSLGPVPFIIIFGAVGLYINYILIYLSKRFFPVNPKRLFIVLAPILLIVPIYFLNNSGTSDYSNSIPLYYLGFHIFIILITFHNYFEGVDIRNTIYAFLHKLFEVISITAILTIAYSIIIGLLISLLRIIDITPDNIFEFAFSLGLALIIPSSLLFSIREREIQTLNLQSALIKLYNYIGLIIHIVSLFFLLFYISVLTLNGFSQILDTGDTYAIFMAINLLVLLGIYFSIQFWQKISDPKYFFKFAIVSIVEILILTVVANYALFVRILEYGFTFNRVVAFSSLVTLDLIILMISVMVLDSTMKGSLNNENLKLIFNKSLYIGLITGVSIFSFIYLIPISDYYNARTIVDDYIALRPTNNSDNSYRFYNTHKIGDVGRIGTSYVIDNYADSKDDLEKVKRIRAITLINTDIDDIKDMFSNDRIWENSYFDELDKKREIAENELLREIKALESDDRIIGFIDEIINNDEKYFYASYYDQEYIRATEGDKVISTLEEPDLIKVIEGDKIPYPNKTSRSLCTQYLMNKLDFEEDIADAICSDSYYNYNW